MYTPLKTQTQQPVRPSPSLFAPKGLDLRDLPELLSPDNALNMQNYLITTDGGLNKRQGITTLFDEGGTDGGTMLERWTDDLLMFGYATILSVYQISTDTVTDIKTDFVNADMDGQAYGDYFFVASSGNHIGRVSRTLAYDGQSGNFTVGLIVTGGTSGATGVILTDVDGGATGTLTLGNIVGQFVDNEVLTDTSTGAALVNGTLNFVYTSISAAPIATTITAIGPRLFAGNIQANPYAVQYSELDNGTTNPPFSTWSVASTATSGGLVSYRNAGTVRSIQALGNNIVVFADDGKWAFAINILDVGGTISKSDDFVIWRQDFGGARGAITTSAGLFYTNEAGLWQVISIGQPNIPFSDQENLASINLGTTYFDDIDLASTSMVYVKKINTLLITCAKSSETNNLVLAYNTVQKAFTKITGWNMSRFTNTQDAVYGISSTTAKVYNIFDGYSDDGADIWTEFYTELKTGELETRQMLLGEYIKGFLSESTELTISFDIYDAQGRFIPDKLSLNWTATAEGVSDGWGEAAWGESGYGGAGDLSSTVESFSGARAYIRNFQRLRVKVSGHDQLPHALTWLKLYVKKQIPIRRRNLTLTT